MFVILVYDINVKRVQKMLKLSRKYLVHIQNSVFEGELTDKQYKEMKKEIKNLINKEYDSVIIYKLKAKYYTRKEELGIKKDEDVFMI